MLTMNELFSGIGTQALALKYLGADYKVVGTSEILQSAINVYNTLHGDTRNYGDISKIDKLDYADLWTYSFPCFTEDALIFTDKGYKSMKEIQIGDQVLTNTDLFKPVVNKFNQGKKEIWNLNVSNAGDIKTTEHHKFWVITRTRDSQAYQYGYYTVYRFSEPHWKECKDLTSDDFIYSSMIYDKKILKKLSKMFSFDEILESIESVKNAKQRTFKTKKEAFTYGLIIQNRFNMPYHIETKENNGKISYCVKFKTDKGQYRLNSFYSNSIYTTNERSYIKRATYWYRVKGVENTHKFEQVYDIEVEDYHSFLVDGVMAKNCQDLSSAGKGKGVAAVDENGEKVVTRSGLLWEVERLLAKSCGYDIVNGSLVENKDYKKDPPKYLLLENVPELIDLKKHRVYFDKWLERLEELGYISSFGKLNGSDFGVPQNRERVFCLSVRKDVYGHKIDLPFIGSTIEMPKKGRIEDFVEKSVLDYKGGLKIDEKISNYLLPAYTRDIEQIAECKSNPLNKKDIWTCKCKSGFQDHRVGITCSPTIRHQNTHTAVFVNNQIHKLTGHECWHFMGIKDEDYQKVIDNLDISDSVMCGLAGNAIVVPVLMSIFNQILRIESGKEPYYSPYVPFLTMNDKARLED